MFFGEKNKIGTDNRLFKSINGYKQLQKIMIIMVLLAGLGFNVGFAKEDEARGLSTVFHIYTDGKYVGMVSDEEKLEQLKEEEIQKAAFEFENLPLTIGTELSVIPERVFTVVTDDDIVLGKLQEILAVEAEAVAIAVDGKQALYVKDMATYDEVIRKLKLQFVSASELNEFEARTVSSESIPPLKENETRIANIVMSSDIQAEDGQTAPKNVMDTKKALTLLKKGTLEDKKYVVQSGDVLGSIAKAHHMKTAQLLELNPEYTTETTLHLGDELNVTVLEPYVEVEVQYETKRKETIKHKTITEKDSTLLKGEKKITRKGVDGEKEVIELIRKQNGQMIGKSIQEEQILSEPIAEVTVIGTKEMPSRGTGSFIWPTVGGYISSQMGARWGSVHQGIDIARPSSRTIKAADNGVVTAVGTSGTYGNRIIISHNNGYETLYAHLSSIDVSVGQTVPQGTAIGIMGSTGRSTGIHLHFEVLKNGTNVNPMSVLR